MACQRGIILEASSPSSTRDAPSYINKSLCPLNHATQTSHHSCLHTLLVGQLPRQGLQSDGVLASLSRDCWRGFDPTQLGRDSICDWSGTGFLLVSRFSSGLGLVWDWFPPGFPVFLWSRIGLGLVSSWFPGFPLVSDWSGTGLGLVSSWSRIFLWIRFAPGHVQCASWAHPGRFLGVSKQHAQTAPRDKHCDISNYE